MAETAALRGSLQDLLAASIAGYPQHQPGAWWLPASYGGSAPTLERAAELDAEERRRRAERARPVFIRSQRTPSTGTDE